MEDIAGVEENVGVGDGKDTDFSTSEGGVDDLSAKMFDDGDVIDNNVNDDTINDDGFVDNISTGNIIDDEDVADDPVVADTIEKYVGGNAATGFTVDNNNLAAHDTIDNWVVGNNPGNDDTGDEDGFGNNFAVNDTADDKVGGDNATGDANDDKDVGVNVVAFDTVNDEYFGENATSAVANDDPGVDVNFASSSFNIDDDNVGDDNTVRKDDVVDACAGDSTMDDGAVDDISDGDDTADEVNDNAAAVVINTDGDSTGNDANTADDNCGHKKIKKKKKREIERMSEIKNASNIQTFF